MALPPHGKVIACDVNEEWTGIAGSYWAEAGVTQKVELRLGPAVETLDGLLSEGLAASFQFVFIDADKENYDSYYERSLELLQPGGLIAVDNVLWSGRVLDRHSHDRDTVAIRAFNEKLLSDGRVPRA